MALPATDNFATGSTQGLATYNASWTVNTSSAFNVVSPAQVVQGANPNFDNLAHWNADTFANDQYSQLKIVSLSSSDIGVAVRVAASAKTAYVMSCSSTATYYSKYVNAAWTSLHADGAAVSAGDVIRLEVSGTTLTFKVNGATQFTVTDSDIAAGSAGLYAYSGISGTGDDWQGGNVVSSVTGALSQVLAAATDSAVGTVLIAGASAQTLAAVTSAAGGSGPINGVVSQTLATLSYTAAGTAPVVGSESQTLAALTPTAAGKVIVVGAEAQTLAALALTGTGSSLAAANGVLYSYLDDPTIFAEAFAPATGTLAKALAALVGVNGGTVVIAGAQASTLAALIDSAAGQVPVGGASAAVLTALTVLATGTGAPASNGVVDAVLSAAAISSGGTLVIAGQESTALDALTTLLHGTLIVNATGGAALGPLSPTAAGVLPIVGVSTPDLAALSLTAAGVQGEYTSGSAALSLEALGLSAAALLIIDGDLAKALAALGVSAAGAGSERPSIRGRRIGREPTNYPNVRVGEMAHTRVKHDS